MAQSFTWLKIDAESWTLSETVAGLSPLGELAMFRLILVVLKKGSIPEDAELCAKLVNKQIPVEAFAEALKCFSPSPEEPGRLIHERTVREIQMAKASWVRSVEGGFRGGQASAKSRSKPDGKKKRTPTATHPSRGGSTYPSTSPSRAGQGTLNPRAVEEEEEEEEDILTNVSIARAPASPKMPEDTLAREMKRLPVILRTAEFAEAWETWLGYLSRQPGRTDFLTIDSHLAICRGIAERKGVTAAINALDYAISARSRRPIEDTRPAASQTAAAAGESTDYQSREATPEDLAAEQDLVMRHLAPLPVRAVR